VVTKDVADGEVVFGVPAKPKSVPQTKIQENTGANE
jgi:hypothetical protein